MLGSNEAKKSSKDINGIYQVFIISGIMGNIVT